MEEHILLMIEAAKAAGIKTYTYTNYEQMYDTKTDFLDTE